MKTGLFDKNAKEIKIGDKYKNPDFDAVYEVFWKSGAVCGGITFEDCTPLGWDFNWGDEPLDCVSHLNWMEIIDEDLTAKEFVEITSRILKYSFEDLDHNYDNLSDAEKELLTEEEFIKLNKYVQ